MHKRKFLEINEESSLRPFLINPELRDDFIKSDLLKKKTASLLSQIKEANTAKSDFQESFAKRSFLEMFKTKEVPVGRKKTIRKTGNNPSSEVVLDVYVGVLDAKKNTKVKELKSKKSNNS